MIDSRSELSIRGWRQRSNLRKAQAPLLITFLCQVKSAEEREDRKRGTSEQLF